MREESNYLNAGLLSAISGSSSLLGYSGGTTTGLGITTPTVGW